MLSVVFTVSCLTVYNRRTHIKREMLLTSNIKRKKEKKNTNTEIKLSSAAVWRKNGDRQMIDRQTDGQIDRLDRLDRQIDVFLHFKFIIINSTKLSHHSI